MPRRKGTRKTELGNCQWCPVSGQKVISKNWNKRDLTEDQHIFTVWVTEHWPRLPREVVEPPSWRASKAIWTWSWAICSAWADGTRWPLEVPSNQASCGSVILWFYVTYFLHHFLSCVYYFYHSYPISFIFCLPFSDYIYKSNFCIRLIQRYLIWEHN